MSTFQQLAPDVLNLKNIDKKTLKNNVSIITKKEKIHLDLKKMAQKMAYSRSKKIHAFSKEFLHNQNTFMQVYFFIVDKYSMFFKVSVFYESMYLEWHRLSNNTNRTL